MAYLFCVEAFSISASPNKASCLQTREDIVNYDRAREPNALIAPEIRETVIRSTICNSRITIFKILPYSLIHLGYLHSLVSTLVSTVNRRRQL